MSAAAALPAIGSAGRPIGSVRRHRELRLAPAGHSDYSSYCLICASWYFSEDIQTCGKCGAHIYLWVPNADLHILRSRSTLAVL